MISLILSALFTLSALAATELTTIAEKSAWKKTGRLEETLRLCKDFARAFPKRVECGNFGTTPEGRPLPYLYVHSGKHQGPVVWVQAGIHAGEIDGKDAVFWLLRDILQQKIPDALKGLRLIFIPIVNVDGHERMGKWNRPNQIGPEEMGWRTTARNLNMNRDFSKADTPEMQSLIKLWNKYDPIMSLDLHVTDGAHFQPEVGLIVLPNTSFGTSALHQLGSDFEAEMLVKMKQKNRKALPFYPSFEDEMNPLSGFSRYVSTPRFSQGYWYARGRLGMLVETHSWKDYKTRVQTHRDTVLSTLEIAQAKAQEWLETSDGFRRENLAGKSVPLEFKNDGKSEVIDFPAYRFEIQDSAISGGKVIRYFTSEPQVWKVPFYHTLVPYLSIKAPTKGYYVPAAVAGLVKEKLDLHEIRYEILKGPQKLLVEGFRASTTEFSPTPFEGRQSLKVAGAWGAETVELVSGSLFVPLEQLNAKLLLHLLEPESKDSFLSWGFFNSFFEKKEYMEAYVAEDVAIEMLKRDPALEKEFKELCERDQAFAKDPDRRHEFFHRRHSSWDQAYNRYPIFRK